jgi:hypothetical protein
LKNRPLKGKKKAFYKIVAFLPKLKSWRTNSSQRRAQLRALPKTDDRNRKASRFIGKSRKGIAIFSNHDFGVPKDFVFDGKIHKAKKAFSPKIAFDLFSFWRIVMA